MFLALPCLTTISKSLSCYSQLKRHSQVIIFVALDAGVGRVVSALKKSGMYRNSVLIFSTDNGGCVPLTSNFPLRGLKGELYQGGVRAVQFVHSPLLTRRGHTSNIVLPREQGQDVL